MGFMCCWDHLKQNVKHCETAWGVIKELHCKSVVDYALGHLLCTLALTPLV